MDKKIPIMKAVVRIENFPSRVEIFQFLDKFLLEKKLPKDYISDNKDNFVTFSFSNPVKYYIKKDLAYDFIKLLNLEKSKNPLYKKIKTSMIMEAQYKEKWKSPKMKSTMQTESNNGRDYRAENKVKKLSEMSPKILEKMIQSDTSLLKDRYIERKGEQFKSLRSSSPYVQPERLNYIEFMKNKEKWISKKVFKVSYGNSADLEKKLEIPNYVRQSPSKINPKTYLFREVDKSKFVGKGDFIYRNNFEYI